MTTPLAVFHRHPVHAHVSKVVFKALPGTLDQGEVLCFCQALAEVITGVVPTLRVVEAEVDTNWPLGTCPGAQVVSALGSVPLVVGAWDDPTTTPARVMRDFNSDHATRGGGTCDPGLPLGCPACTATFTVSTSGPVPHLTLVTTQDVVLQGPGVGMPGTPPVAVALQPGASPHEVAAMDAAVVAAGHVVAAAAAAGVHIPTPGPPRGMVLLKVPRGVAFSAVATARLGRGLDHPHFSPAWAWVSTPVAVVLGPTATALDGPTTTALVAAAAAFDAPHEAPWLVPAPGGTGVVLAPRVDPDPSVPGGGLVTTCTNPWAAARDLGAIAPGVVTMGPDAAFTTIITIEARGQMCPGACLVAALDTLDTELATLAALFQAAELLVE